MVGSKQRGAGVVVKRVYAPETQHEIIDAYKRGVQIRTIVAEYKIGTSRLYDLLTEHGISPDRVRHGKPRRRPMVSPYVQRACEDKHIGYVDIAELIGYAHKHTYIVLTGCKRMTKFFAQRLAEVLQLDGDRIYREAAEWWQENKGGRT